LLQLGAGAAIVLAAAGSVAVLVKPGLAAGKLSPAARDVFLGAGQAILDQSLPAGDARSASLAAFLQRVDALVSNLPAHVQGELSQLLAILCTAPGRVALVGLREDWTRASVAEVQAALQDMRTSGTELRRQAYQALHDITGAAYFADASTWPALGYPGPRDIG
jgi:hypothetical protein